MKNVIAFRGRNTENILSDARQAGIVEDNDRILIICREGDTLREEGDRTVVEFIKNVFPHINAEIKIIVNGGTTAQVVPLLAAFITAASKGHTPWWATAIDLQRDGVVVLWESLTSWLAPRTIRLAGPLVGWGAVEEEASRWDAEARIEEVRPRVWLVTTPKRGLIGVITK